MYGTPHFLMLPLAADWARPSLWRPLGELAFKLEAGQPLDLELGRLNQERRFVQHSIQLVPGQRQTLATDFFSVSYLRAGAIPQGRMGLTSPAARLRVIAEPKQWGNLWVYGRQLSLLGYASGRELLNRRRGGSGRATKSLRPIAELCERTRAWARNEKIGS